MADGGACDEVGVSGEGVIKVSFRYSHVWSWFEDLIITNMMVESKFNFDV